MTSAIGSGAHSGLTIAKVAQVVDMALVSVRETKASIARYGAEAVVITPKKVGRSQAAVSVAALREIADSSRAAYESAAQANALVQAAVKRLDIPESIRLSVKEASDWVASELSSLNGTVQTIENARRIVDGTPEIHAFKGTAEALKDIVKRSDGNLSNLFFVGSGGNKHRPFTLLQGGGTERRLVALQEALLTADSVASTRVGTSSRMKEQLASIDPELVATFEDVFERPLVVGAAVPAPVPVAVVVPVPVPALEVAAGVADTSVPVGVVEDVIAATDDVDVALAARIDDALEAAPVEVSASEPDTSWMDNIVMPKPRVRPSAAVDDAILDRATAAMNRA